MNGVVALKKGHVFTTKGMILSKNVYIWSMCPGRFRHFRDIIGTQIWCIF